jgi:hypothetical protein
MPLLLLWHPRSTQAAEIPQMELEIVGYTRRWTIAQPQTRWHVIGVTSRWQVIVHAARWVVMETRRMLWRL